MSDSLRIIGDIMKDAGYYSALNGKWHLGKSTIQGNDDSLTSLENYGFSDWGGTDYIGSLWQGHDKDPVILSEVREWLSDKGKELNSQGKSFFLMLTMINHHDITGYQSPTLHLGGAPDDKIYDTSYSNPIQETYDFDLTAQDLPQGIKLYNHNWSILAGSFDISDTRTTGLTIPELWKDYQDYYFNCIQDSDNNLQKVLESLRANNMLGSTIIIFTADHGEMHGSHGLKGKGGFIYENNIHVPLIIVHPDYEGGRKIQAITSHIDLAATLADIAGVSESEDLPGQSLMPLLDSDSDKDSVRDDALFCYEMLSMSAPCFVSNDKVSYNFKAMGRGMVRGLITQDGYKFVRYFSPEEFNTPQNLDELFANNDVQLFNMNEDPEELINLASPGNKAANSELIMTLNQRLNNIIASEIGEEDSSHVLNPLREYIKTLQ